MSEFLREAARLQPALVQSLKTLHRRAIAAIEEAAIADTMLDAREAPSGSGSAATERPSSSANGRPPGSDTGTWGAAGASNPLRSLQAPDALTVKPLVELELLALRAAQLLRRRHAAERRLSLLLTVTLAVFLGLAVVLIVATDMIASGAVLIVGALVAFAVLRWKWQPFRRALRSQTLVDLAEEMSAGVRSRIAAIDRLPDHATRHLQQWKAVLELTEPLRDLWGG
ncbi:MAG: hypothetical protein R3B09_27455 [Nannocystaceae bacterium]